MNIQDASTYRAYLVRLWRDNNQAVWRASLQSTATEELLHFASVSECWTYLLAQIQDGTSNPHVGEPWSD